MNAEVVAELLTDWMETSLRLMHAFSSDYDDPARILAEAKEWAARIEIPWDDVTVPDELTGMTT